MHTGDTFHSCFGDDVHQHSSVTDDPLRVFDSNLHVHPNAGRLGIRIVDDVRVPTTSATGNRDRGIVRGLDPTGRLDFRALRTTV